MNRYMQFYIVAVASMISVLSAFVSSKKIFIGDSPIYGGFPLPYAVKQVGTACSTPLVREINYLKLNLGIEDACGEGMRLKNLIGNLAFWFVTTSGLFIALTNIGLFKKYGKRL